MNSSSHAEQISQSAHDISYMTSLGLESNISTVATDKIFYYHRGVDELDDKTPILIMIHGYPQSNFMWRHVSPFPTRTESQTLTIYEIIPLLSPQIPLFIPDIPGYGRSAPLTIPHSKLNTGLSILSALHTLLPKPNTRTAYPIILAGHDRGALISQRLTVSNPHTSFKIIGTILLDITPSLTRWSSFSSLSTAVEGFHWPFLANASLATSMINALGGDVWARFCLERWSGNSTTGLSKFQENQAREVYMRAFRHENIVAASCDDYRAGAEEDVVQQEEDQKAGRKMDCSVLKVYSELFLGSK